MENKSQGMCPIVAELMESIADMNLHQQAMTNIFCKKLGVNPQELIAEGQRIVQAKQKEMLSQIGLGELADMPQEMKDFLSAVLSGSGGGKS